MRAGAGGAGAHVHHHQTRAAGELAGQHEVYFRGAVDEAANQAIGLARDLAELFAEPPSVDLSGGRDSRISAAGAVAAEIDCRFSTGDQEPGEVEIAKQLVETAPHRLEHLVTRPETDPDDDLRRRVRAIHLVHDGMRNPQEIRRPMPLPLPVEPTRPTLSGHGGEIAHGFYYPSPEEALRDPKGRRGGPGRPPRAGGAPKARRRPPRRLPRLPLGGRGAPSTRGAATASPAPTCSTTSTSSTGSPTAPGSAPAAGATPPAPPRPSSAPPSTSPPSSASTESSTTS